MYCRLDVFILTFFLSCVCAEQEDLEFRVKQDIEGLEAVNRLLFLELNEQHAMRARLDESKTIKGRYFNLLGYVLSVYCLYKLVMTAANLVLGRVGKIDPVTRGMEIASDWLGLNVDVPFWSQHISFILVGIIIVTSVRSLLIRLTKVVCSGVRLARVWL